MGLKQAMPMSSHYILQALYINRKLIHYVKLSGASPKSGSLISSLNFGVTRRWSPKSLDLGVSSFYVTPKSKDLGLQPYPEIYRRYHNIGNNLSLNEEFNELYGFTQDDVKNILKYFYSKSFLKLDPEFCLKIMTLWYNNYKFSKNANKVLYNLGLSFVNIQNRSNACLACFKFIKNQPTEISSLSSTCSLKIT